MDTNNNDIQKYWSLKEYEPRTEQIRIIEEIITAMDLGFKNIILEAGTGIGKSAIATTIANLCDNSYILTMTNQLQKQYLDDFNYMLTEIKGRRNYTCNHGGTCEECYMEQLKEKKCNDCEYILALREALTSKNIITNYDYIWFAGNYTELFSKRDLLIMDEAHNLESKIMGLISRTLNRKSIIKNYGFDIFDKIMNKELNLKDLKEENYWINILEKLITIEKTFKNNTTDDQEIKKIDNKIQNYQTLINSLSSEDERWIIELPSKKQIISDKDFKAGLKVEFKPLTVNQYAENIFRFGETRLFLTGTLGNKDKFCEWLGLDADDTFYIYQKSPFSVSNRPIIRDYIGSMSGRDENHKSNWRNPKAIMKIKEIVSKHAGQKGVIHTSSNEQAWYLKKNLDSKNVWVVGGSTREETLAAFEKSYKPITLIGAGIKDGVDFKGDKCRYQIIFKMPYPRLEGQIFTRNYYDPTWYKYQTIMPLMQAYGRGIRDLEDYCTTYVIDSDFDQLLNNYKYLFNEYFLEAIHPPLEDKVKRKRIKRNEEEIKI